MRNHRYPRPPGNADECENKGVVKIATRKLVKRNGLKIDERAVTRELGETPTHPRYFGKRGWKLLKTKNGDRKKRGKRFQEAASS